MTAKYQPLKLDRDQSTEWILARIEKFQSIMKKCPPSSTTWKAISARLAPLFREMARRTRS